MSITKKISPQEKEKKLIEKIEKAKSQLARLQEKRRLEIAKIAYKHGLDQVDNKILDKAFKQVAVALSSA